MTKPDFTALCVGCNRSYQRRPAGFCPNEKHQRLYEQYASEVRKERDRFRSQTRQMELTKVPRITRAPKITTHPALKDVEPGGYFYLASPFWHELKTIRLKRYLIAKQTAIELDIRGFVISAGVPNLIDSHQANLFEMTQEESHSWLERALVFLRQASVLFILYSIGETMWYNSAGCRTEFGVAYELDIPICFIDPIDYSVRRVDPYERERLHGAWVV